MGAFVVLLVLVGGCESRRTSVEAVAPVPRVSQRSSSPPIEHRAAAGRMVEIGNIGDAHHPRRRIVAYVPANAREPLPVLYVTDGSFAFDDFDIDGAMDDLSARGTIEPWVVVAIPNHERDNELARRPDAFIDFVADVVHPAVAARIRLRNGRADAALLGYSYGGLAALRSAQHRPDRFGRVITMSPSLWFRGRAYLEAFRRDHGPLPTRMWIDIGSDEGRFADEVPYMVRDARALRDAAIARGMRFGRDVGYDEAIGHRHDMRRVVVRRIRTALAFALSDRDLSETAPSHLRIARFRPNAHRRCAFAVQARYDEPFQLTWPPSSAEVRTRSGGTVRDVVTPSTPLRACVHGATAELD